MTLLPLAKGYRLTMPPAVLNDDGRCRLSDLLPAECGLSCHRNCEDLPIVDDLFDDGERLAA